MVALNDSVGYCASCGSSIYKLDWVDIGLMTGNTVKYGSWTATVDQPDFLAKTSCPWDGGDKTIKAWKDVTEKPQTIEYGPRAAEVGMVVAGSEQRVVVEGIPKYITPDIEVALPMNLVGKYLSKCETVRQAHQNYENSPEHQRRVKFLEGQGFERTSTIEAYGVRKMSCYASVFHDGESAILTLNANISGVARQLMKQYGVSYQEAIEYLLSHEDTHLFNKGTKSKLDEERKLEALLKEFNEALAKKEPAGYTDSVPGTERTNRGKYKRLAKISEDREENVKENYPQYTLWGRIVRGLKGENIDALIETLVEEAKEAGCETRDEIREYVARRAREYEAGDGKEDKSRENRDDESDQSKENNAKSEETNDKKGNQDKPEQPESEDNAAAEQTDSQ